MTLTRRIYPRPPIIEAVIELRFLDDVPGAKLHAAIQSKLGEEYPDTPSASISADDMTFVASRDQKRMLGFGANLLSIHVLEPYPGWEQFIRQAQDALQGVLSVVKGPLQAVAVRYVDRITLRAVGRPFHDFVRIMPFRPEAMPENLQTFYHASTSIHKDGCTTVTLVLASTTPDGNFPRMIIDIGARREREAEPLCDIRTSDWLQVVDELHTMQRTIFEDSITDAMRELFQ